MKRKREKESINTEHYHHRYDWSKVITQIFLFLILLILFTNIIGSGSRLIESKETVYKKCIDGCSKKNFIGERIGFDTFPSNCYVNEFDRTNCIQNCNQLYAGLKGYLYVFSKD